MKKARTHKRKSQSDVGLTKTAVEFVAALAIGAVITWAIMFLLRDEIYTLFLG